MHMQTVSGCMSPCVFRPACSSAALRYAWPTRPASTPAASTVCCSTADRRACGCSAAHQTRSLQHAACGLAACRRVRPTAASSARGALEVKGLASEHSAGMGCAAASSSLNVVGGSSAVGSAVGPTAAGAARARVARSRAVATGSGAAAGAITEPAAGGRRTATATAATGAATGATAAGAATAGPATSDAPGAGTSSGVEAESASSTGLRERVNLAAGATCSACGGEGTLPCKGCGGSGRLGRAGYNKKNTLNMSRILNSKWTAMQQTLGWRHFRVMQLRKGAGGLVFLHMQASCDPTAQMWVNSQILRDRSYWAAGWLQMSEIQDAEAAKEATGSPCQRCSALGRVPCPRCKSSGAALIDI